MSVFDKATRVEQSIFDLIHNRVFANIKLFCFTIWKLLNEGFSILYCLFLPMSVLITMLLENSVMNIERAFQYFCLFFTFHEDSSRATSIFPFTSSLNCSLPFTSSKLDINPFKIQTICSFSSTLFENNFGKFAQAFLGVKTLLVTCSVLSILSKCSCVVI